MNITSKSKYALRAVIHMARTMPKSARRGDLAAAQGGISTEYLEKILLRLRERRIVEAKSGPGGGYRLSVPDTELTAWDIISAVEESPAPVSCLTESPKNCEGFCEAKSLWVRVWEAAVREMRNTTIASLAEEAKVLENLGSINAENGVIQCR